MATSLPITAKFNSFNLFSEEVKSRLALNYSQIGVWEYDADLHRVFFSEGSKQIIGIYDEDFGKNPFDWNNRVHPEDQDRYFQDFQDHASGRKDMYENEHRVRCADGQYKWIRDRGKIVEWNEDGSYRRIIGTHTDITELKRSELKMENALAVATEHNNRLKNFAHIVTHNLKQHSGNLENLIMLTEQAESQEERDELFDYLKTLSAAFSKTVSNLNTIVSSQASAKNTRQRIRVKEDINQILELLQPLIKASETTVKNLVNPKLVVYFNRSYFESIVQNLLTNAIKYRHPERPPMITISCENTLDAIILKIQDNGLGIDLKKYGGDLFGLYKTFHKNEDAEGVGLYLVKNQIESFGGSIHVDSEVNVGTTFTIIVNKLSHSKII